MTENCDVVGSHETKAVSHLDEQNPERGLKVTYNLGDLCLDIEPQNVNGHHFIQASSTSQVRRCYATKIGYIRNRVPPKWQGRY